MVKRRFLLQNIQGLTPAVDARQSENLAFVLHGRNYIVDSKGPKSFFASRLVNRCVPVDALPNAANVQSGADLIFTRDSAGFFSSTTLNEWQFNRIFTYPAPIRTDFIWRRWTTAFVGATLFIAHPGIGLWKRTVTGFVQVDPGIAGPQAIVETNGRLVVLGSTAVAWSGPANPEDFTPALGGAGFQIISERISGAPFMLTTNASGYIVWTTSGSLVGEFIAGDLVFRHYISRHSHKPINDMAYVRMPDNSYLICTRQGIFTLAENNEPAPATPVFNEFFRELIKTVQDAGLRIRLDYDRESDLLFLQLRNESTFFNTTFVLTVAIDKWGEFNQSHLGIIELGIKTEPVRSLIGYVDTKGIAHRFIPYGSSREVAHGVFEGLDSEVVLGPLRAPDLLQQFYDVEQELQGFFLSNHARPEWSQNLIEQLDENNGTALIDEGIDLLTGMPNTPIEESDSHTPFPHTTNRVSVIADWSGFDPAGFLFHGSTDPSIQMAVESVPSVSHAQVSGIHYTTLSPGIWHRVRIKAVDVNEYFHITAGEFTFDLSGRLGT